MLIDHSQLASDTLHNLLEEIVTRDGTDYGEDEMRLDEKIQRLRHMLDTGECYISYDETTQSCGVVPRHSAEN